ncbi:MAG: SpoIIE family protein phosphatase, partial [Spirochaetales bacterium]|nr:SpoIIE family protein phosphatase [Candidatus Physcosoma equi]
AMFMMTAKTLIKNLALTGMSMEEVFTKANEELCANNDAEMFITAWIGCLDTKTGTIFYSNAGHNPPLIRHRDGSFEYLQPVRGFVLAGMDGYRYRKGELKLERDDEIFLYTDGVTEATDKDGNLFGEGRLKETLDTLGRYVPMEELCVSVKKAIDEFVGEAPQFDDITMLGLSYKGENTMVEMNIEATIENIPVVTEFVDAELEKYNCPMKAQIQIDIAIDELFSNIARYAYNPETGPATVRVEVEEDPLSVIITFIDNGVPYNPLAHEDPDTTLSAEEREIGGLGILLVKKSMDAVEYSYKDGQNILNIRKNF